MRKVKIGVLGCAAIAKRSVIPAIISCSEKFELVCIASRSAEKAKEFANDFNCKAVFGYDNIFNEDIDAVYVPLPTGLHKEWITKAINNGLHVYAEKSLAYSYDDAVLFVENSRNKNLALMEGYMFQYHTQHQIVKDMLKEETVGELRLFTSSFGFPPLDSNNFRYDDVIGGGVLHDAAGYPLRALHFLLGNSFDVEASTLYFDNQKSTETYGSAFLSNKKGIGAQISFGFDNYYQCFYELWGSNGKIKVHRAFTPGPDFKPLITVEFKNGDKEDIYADACNHFIKAIDEFYNIISDEIKRERHYNDILLQSKSLKSIKELA